MSDKIKEAAIEFLAELNAQLKGWQDEVDSPEKEIRISQLMCVINGCGAADLHKALGAVAIRKIHKISSEWWESTAG